MASIDATPVLGWEGDATSSASSSDLLLACKVEAEGKRTSAEAASQAAAAAALSGNEIVAAMWLEAEAKLRREVDALEQGTTLEDIEVAALVHAAALAAAAAPVGPPLDGPRGETLPLRTMASPVRRHTGRQAGARAPAVAKSGHRRRRVKKDTDTESSSCSCSSSSSEEESSSSESEVESEDEEEISGDGQEEEETEGEREDEEEEEEDAEEEEGGSNTELKWPDKAVRAGAANIAGRPSAIKSLSMGPRAIPGRGAAAGQQRSLSMQPQLKLQRPQQGLSRALSQGLPLKPAGPARALSQGLPPQRSVPSSSSDPAASESCGVSPAAPSLIRGAGRGAEGGVSPCRASPVGGGKGVAFAAQGLTLGDRAGGLCPGATAGAPYSPLPVAPSSPGCPLSPRGITQCPLPVAPSSPKGPDASRGGQGP